MKVKVRIVENFSTIQQSKLEALGIKVKAEWDAFMIDVDNSIIEQVLKIVDNSIIQRVAVFTETDRNNSPFLNIRSNKILGYAKPDEEDEVDAFPYPFDIYPYYKDVFEIVNTDPNYGMLRGKQVGSYSLSGEPKWGKKHIASAHYIEDSFFTTPEVYQTVFQPLGIKCLPVFNYKTKKTAKDYCSISSARDKLFRTYYRQSTIKRGYYLY